MGEEEEDEPEQQQPGGGGGGGGGVIVLMGDLNAMTRSDYSAEEWAAHEKRNADAGWEPPATGERD